MTASRSAAFGPFVLDAANQCVRRGGREIPLTPKAWETLRALVERRGTLVTKRELLDRVWPDVTVGDAVLKVVVHEIRRALGDDPGAPRYVQTLHRRGYRFIAAVEPPEPPTRAGGERQPSAAAPPGPPTEASAAAAPFVGREAAEAALDAALARAAARGFAAVFVAGEPGIGKTTLLERFARRAEASDRATVARGSGMEHFGAAEPFLPFVEALTSLLRGPDADRVRDALVRLAPAWLVRVPGASGAREREALARRTLGATRDGMLRELADAVADVAAHRAFVLVLEDLHWSDPSSVDALVFLARQRRPAGVLVVGTYRPADLVVGEHPLRPALQDLRARREADAIVLGPLRPAETAAYVRARFPSAPGALAEALHRRTDGHPFHLTCFADELARTGGAAASDADAAAIPDTARQMLSRQIERLGEPDRRLLETAAVAGAEFGADAVAAAEDRAVVDVEERFERLVRRGEILRDADSAGSSAARYAFVHSIVGDFLLHGIPAARRRRTHQRLGARLAASADDAGAAEAARHLAAAGDSAGAAGQFERAASRAARSAAHSEAVVLLERALHAAGALPDAARLPRTESIRTRLAHVHRASGDMVRSAEEARRVAASARRRGDAADEARAQLVVASAASWFDRDAALAAAERAAELEPAVADAGVRTAIAGQTAYWRMQLVGWDDADLAASGAAIAAARATGDRALLGWQLGRHSSFLCMRSQYRAAWDAADEAQRIAVEAGDPYEMLLARFCGAWSLIHSGVWGLAREVLAESLDLAERHGHTRWATLFRVETAWLLEHAGDLAGASALAGRAVDDARRDGSAYGELVSCAILAFADLAAGDADRAETRLADARSLLARGRIVMDWVWETVLEHGTSEVGLLRGDLDAAERHARRTLELASVPGEVHNQALAERRLAVVALGRGDLAAAGASARRALEHCARADVPLAAWRCRETAARIADAEGRGADAVSHRKHRDHVLARISATLASDPALQARFREAAAAELAAATAGSTQPVRAGRRARPVRRPARDGRRSRRRVK